MAYACTFASLVTHLLLQPMIARSDFLSPLLSPVFTSTLFYECESDPGWKYDCGGDSWNKTSTFTCTCECREGYCNILNITAFPCLKEFFDAWFKRLGWNGCLMLGISFTNSNLHQSFPWLMVLIMSLAMIQWKQNSYT
ncbi:hypothetical protein P3X46_006191 [Hevea brasiliensis]|uniref:Uncharacterized protein n=1 Tax=Hevea brasiliensis TaxID=3981 RepID=A0ABQ9MSR7_HEVBR|nr:hypothetical protein P3X46_006191 [Hevea brasiliensis]